MDPITQQETSDLAAFNLHLQRRNARLVEALKTIVPRIQKRIAECQALANNHSLTDESRSRNAGAVSVLFDLMNELQVTLISQVLTPDELADKGELENRTSQQPGAEGASEVASSAPGETITVSKQKLEGICEILQNSLRYYTSVDALFVSVQIANNALAEVITGKCIQCGGTGKVSVGGGCMGHEDEPCKACKGTGVPQ